MSLSCCVSVNPYTPVTPGAPKTGCCLIETIKKIARCCCCCCSCCRPTSAPATSPTHMTMDGPSDDQRRDIQMAEVVLAVPENRRTESDQKALMRAMGAVRAPVKLDAHIAGRSTQAASPSSSSSPRATAEELAFAARVLNNPDAASVPAAAVAKTTKTISDLGASQIPTGVNPALRAELASRTTIVEQR